jgi:hypothetical protein
MRTAFVTHIRPLPEYNSVVWNPSQKQLIDLNENVQRNFTKRIPSLSSLSYHERLAFPNLEPLELRRLRFDPTYYYKVLLDLTPLSPLTPYDVFTIYMPIDSSRSRPLYLRKLPKASNVLSSSFFCRNVDAWNSLPPSLRHASSVLSFKHRLKLIDMTSFSTGTSIMR